MSEIDVVHAINHACATGAWYEAAREIGKELNAHVLAENESLRAKLSESERETEKWKTQAGTEARRAVDNANIAINMMAQRDDARRQLAEAQSALSGKTFSCGNCDGLAKKLEEVTRERDRYADAWASTADALNQELRENGPADVGQYTRPEDTKNGIRYLVDLLRRRFVYQEKMLDDMRENVKASDEKAETAESRVRELEEKLDEAQKRLQSYGRLAEALAKADTEIRRLRGELDAILLRGETPWAEQRARAEKVEAEAARLSQWQEMMAKAAKENREKLEAALKSEREQTARLESQVSESRAEAEEYAEMLKVERERNEVIRAKTEVQFAYITELRAALANHSCDPERQKTEVNWADLLLKHGANAKALAADAPGEPKNIDEIAGEYYVEKNPDAEKPDDGEGREPKYKCADCNSDNCYRNDTEGGA